MILKAQYDGRKSPTTAKHPHRGCCQHPSQQSQAGTMTIVATTAQPKPKRTMRQVIREIGMKKNEKGNTWRDVGEMKGITKKKRT